MTPSLSPMSPTPTVSDSEGNILEHFGLDPEIYPEAISKNDDLAAFINNLDDSFHLNVSIDLTNTSNIDVQTGGKNGTHPPQQPQQIPVQYESRNNIVVGTLIGLIILLCLILAFVTLPPLFNYFRRRMPVPKKRIDRRYATIDGWLVTKTAQQHDCNCDRITALYGKRSDGARQGARIHNCSTEKDGDNGDEENGSICKDDSTGPSHQKGESDNLSSKKFCHGGDATIGGCDSDIIDHEFSGYEDDKFALVCSALLEKLGIPEHGSKGGRRRNGKLGKNRGSSEKTKSDSKGTAVEPRSSGDTKKETSSVEGLSANVALSEAGKIDNEFDPDTTKHQHLTNDQPDENSKSSINSDGSMTQPSCAICLERFKVGDMVSWSSNERCPHTYHHACIREWLLRKVGCPYCREVVLAVDRPTRVDERYEHTSRRRQLTEDELSKLANERSFRATTTYFCVDCGLVALEGFGADHWAKINELCRASGTPGKQSSKTRVGSSNHRERWQFWRQRRADSEQRQHNIHMQNDMDITNTSNSLPIYDGCITTTSGGLSRHMEIVANDTMDEDDDYDDDGVSNHEGEGERSPSRGLDVDVEAQANEQR